MGHLEKVNGIEDKPHNQSRHGHSGSEKEAEIAILPHHFAFRWNATAVSISKFSAQP
jgi:hypothetical protein